MTQVYQSAYEYVFALSGNPDTDIYDFRAIHDTDKGAQAHNNRGTLAQCWNWIIGYNNAGYGIFAVVASLDGFGRELTNVAALRAHYVDLDNLSSEANYARARTWVPVPSFGVNSSPRKHHVYWSVMPYTGNDYFATLQRKLYTVFDGDKRVIDAARVMRLPGTYHLKDPTKPHLVTIERMGAFGQRYDVNTIAAAVANVTVLEGGSGSRHDLGDPALSAPGREWLTYALQYADPNQMDRSEWIAFTSAWKQAASLHFTPDEAFDVWSQWCAKYDENDTAENHKQWHSIRNTELGWKSIMNRIPAVKAAWIASQRPQPTQPTQQPGGAPEVPPMPPATMPDGMSSGSEYLDLAEQQEYFRDCVFIADRGQILVPNGRFLNVGQFNAIYGGKKFLLDGAGKYTDEAWKAATRCTLWRIPIIDHVRFIPDQMHRAVITDDLGRQGVNVYKPALIERLSGDPSPFLHHMATLLPTPEDLRTVIEYLAHNVKYPGVKIPWAPVIQSAEGAGKGVVKTVMMHACGRSYTYFPNAHELTNSGAQFNAWMRHKLFILADEIKVDDRRDLVEILKPMISEKLIEVQAKGFDQAIEDNFANWLFFTNYKDAIPVSHNGRRYAVIFSPIQTAGDLIRRNMDEYYFKTLYAWLNGEGNYPFGAAIVTDYLMNYPIERGAIPMRAPITSSMPEAIEISRSPLERMIIEATNEMLPGFRGGWVSVQSVIKRAKTLDIIRSKLTPQTVQTVLEGLGYVACGRSPRPFFQEDREIRSLLYHLAVVGDPGAFGQVQGWE